jgi:hypothetical protein
MDTLFTFLRNHLPLAVILLLVIPVGAVSVTALVWQSEHEVLWHGSWILKHCGLTANGTESNCIGQYELSFGNTGDHGEEVLLDWPVDLRQWSMDWRVLNLSADRRRANDPNFTCRKMAESTTCAIADFAAGTLLTIKLRCLLCNRAQLHAMDQNPPVVTSQARVYSSDPRATLLFRRLGILLSWL